MKGQKLRFEGSRLPLLMAFTSVLRARSFLCVEGVMRKLCQKWAIRQLKNIFVKSITSWRGYFLIVYSPLREAIRNKNNGYQFEINHVSFW
jgi:hypothetical protein